jgi:hypothetical protein
MAKKAAAPDQNGLGNLAKKYEYFTRADDANMRYTMCLNAVCLIPHL